VGKNETPVVVIGKVRVLLANGSEEVWLTPLRHTHLCSLLSLILFTAPAALTLTLLPALSCPDPDHLARPVPA
jgi:hypothetical protein